MKITVLIDNTPGQNDPGLFAEKGLSFYIEANGAHILLDTGLTGKFATNAAIMGLDIASVDALVLSHGHIDHTGGLQRFMQENSKATIYMSAVVSQSAYYSDRHGKRHSLSPDHYLINENMARFVLLENNAEIMPNVFAVFNKSTAFPFPSGNRYLGYTQNGTTQPYHGNDEIALVVKENESSVVFSPCSHSGVLNILNACKAVSERTDIVAFFGGLHLLDEEFGNDVSGMELAARTITEKYPHMALYTGHCTGCKACRLLSCLLAGQFVKFRTGDVFYPI